MAKILVRKGRLIDPANSIDETLDVLCVDGKVAAVGRDLDPADSEVIEAAGMVVAPGLVDMHCHLRVPGHPEREDLVSGTRGAAMGGFTTIVPHPNTVPVIDSVEVLEMFRKDIAREARVNVFPSAAVTVGEAGEKLTDLAQLARAGVPAFSDDGRPVAGAALMRTALLCSRDLGRPICQHSEDKSLSAGGAMFDGEFSRQLGYPGIPYSAESSMVARDIVLAKETGGHLHVCHVSCAPTVDLIRFAKSWGVKVTAEATHHHFTLTDRHVAGQGTNAKVNPPLAGDRDVAAVKKGLQDGTIDAIATDHAPWLPEEKNTDFEAAPTGLIGFETALSLVLSELVEPGLLTLSQALAKLTCNPSRILTGVNKGHLSVGADADLILIDLERLWPATPAAYQSKSRNCPYSGRVMKGKVELTMVGGRVIMRGDRFVD